MWPGQFSQLIETEFRVYYTNIRKTLKGAPFLTTETIWSKYKKLIYQTGSWNMVFLYKVSVKIIRFCDKYLQENCTAKECGRTNEQTIGQ